MATKKKSKVASPQRPAQTTGPQFAEFQPTSDPTAFKIKHPSDDALYNELNKKLVQPIRELKKPKTRVLTLNDVLGDTGDEKTAAIQKAGQIVFHSVGDTGPTEGPKNVCAVADKIKGDYENETLGNLPSFLFHLGDVVYSFGEGKYYYDQFYDPFRDYPAPILAIPGNHDGMVYNTDTAQTLDAFLRNFCSDKPIRTAEAGGLLRTAMIQPGVYFAFDAPFINIIALYSNVLEDPGVISSENGTYKQLTDEQLVFLEAQLTRVKDNGNAVLLAVHHPPFAYGGNHAGSPKMTAEIDTICQKVGFWPHAVISGHAHSYQRFTRTVGNYDVPYIICGNSGHNVTALKAPKNTPLRAPSKISSTLIFENYDDKNYGYLRIVCNKQILRIEYHDTDPSQKTYGDAVTVDLKSHTLIAN